MLAGDLRLARAGDGREVGVAQRLVGGSQAPFVGGLILVAHELRVHRLHGREFVGDLCQAPGDLGQSLRAGRGAGRMADIDRRRFGPGAGQRGEPKATVRGDPGFAVDGIVVGAGDARQQALDDTCRHRAVGRHVGLQPTGERKRMRRSLQQLRVVQQRAAVAGLQLAVGRDPCIEQTGGFERGLEAGALRSRDRVAKVHQLPERRTRAHAPASASRVYGLRRRRIDAGFEPGALALRVLLVLPPASDVAPSSETRRCAKRTLACCCATCKRCRAGLSPCSATTQSARAVSAARPSSGLTRSCFRLAKWRSQA